MTYLKHHRLARAVQYLPEVFAVQPTSDYAVFIPDSAQAMIKDAWQRTTAQMHEAVAKTMHLDLCNKYKVQALPEGDLAFRGQCSNFMNSKHSGSPYRNT